MTQTISSKSSHKVFGIRHHGPGSARSLIAALEELKPDCILIEGPADANSLIEHAGSAEMTPPVAMLIYDQDDLKRSVYYPFALFSPEWQAIQWGLANKVKTCFMDLPQANWLALSKEEEKKAQASEGQAGEAEATEADDTADPADSTEALLEERKSGLKIESQLIRRDPLRALALCAGYDDSERWWENLIEHRRAKLDVFAAISEAMNSLRAELADADLRGQAESADSKFESKIDDLREAHMRQCIRSASKDGFQNIAVVCGAWHTPALESLAGAKDDQAKLKGLPKLKVDFTWIPWTNARLSFESGYGAGLQSPGWYQHLWTSDELVLPRWLAKAARLLRQEDLDASSAHIIETVRLAETLAAMRGMSLPGLSEISDATESVLCFGNAKVMDLLHEKLIVGQFMGQVPENLPGTPLQKDLEKAQKSLRLPAQAAEKIYDLDLRNENDLKRSHLLHRLEILNICWGNKEKVSGKSGTFHELWRLRWTPDLALKIIEASIWGKTVEEASANFACAQSDKSGELARLTELLDHVLLADLPAAGEHVLARLASEAAIAADIKHLMAAVPALVQIKRYGNVRKTSLFSVGKILDGLIARICAGLTAACSLLDEAAAEDIFSLLLKMHSAIDLLQNSAYEDAWKETLLKLAETSGINALVCGRACRLLFDKRSFDSQEAARRFSLALSRANDPLSAASWADGFLRGSGLVLVHDSELLKVVDAWVQSISDESFTEVLPLLRRSFSTYPAPERRQIGERIARSHSSTNSKQERARLDSAADKELNYERAEKILPAVAQLLGLKVHLD